MVQWAELNTPSLTHTQRETTEIFNSAIWKKGYNPYLIFVLDMCVKSVLGHIPRTQHHPICISVNPVIVPQPTTSRRHFNLGRVLTEFDSAIEEANSIPENYGWFIELLRRGVQKTHSKWI